MRRFLAAVGTMGVIALAGVSWAGSHYQFDCPTQSAFFAPHRFYESARVQNLGTGWVWVHSGGSPAQVGYGTLLAPGQILPMSGVEAQEGLSCVAEDGGTHKMGLTVVEFGDPSL